MKWRNIGLSMGLCVLLLGSTHVKAAAESSQVPKFKSIQAQFDNATYKIKVVVESSEEASELGDEANLCYVSSTGKDATKKEVKLTLSNGKYEATLDKNDLKGQWKPSFIVLKDKKNNVAITYNSKVHMGLGQDLSTGDIKEDIIPGDTEVPKLVAIEAKLEHDTVKFSLTASDNLSGLGEEANLCYVMKNGKKLQKKEVTLKLINGKYEGSAQLLGDKGLWQVDYIILEDGSKNATVIYNTKIHAGLGQDLSSGDVNTTGVKEDTTPVEFLGLKAIIKGEKVEIAVQASDNLSGLAEEASLCYVLDSGSVVSKKEVDLILSNGTYTGTLDLKDFNGRWKVSYLILKDKAENVKIIYNANVHPGLGQDLSAGDITNLEKNMLIESLNTKDEFKLGKEAVVKVRVTNPTFTQKNATLIVGVYNATNKIFDVKSQEKTLKSGDREEIGCTLKIPEKGAYVIRAYVWDSIEGMKPISNDVIEFQVSK